MPDPGERTPWRFAPDDGRSSWTAIASARCCTSDNRAACLNSWPMRLSASARGRWPLTRSTTEPSAPQHSSRAEGPRLPACVHLRGRIPALTGDRFLRLSQPIVLMRPRSLCAAVTECGMTAVSTWGVLTVAELSHSCYPHRLNYRSGRWLRSPRRPGHPHIAIPVQQELATRPGPRSLKATVNDTSAPMDSLLPALSIDRHFTLPGPHAVPQAGQYQRGGAPQSGRRASGLNAIAMWTLVYCGTRY